MDGLANWYLRQQGGAEAEEQRAIPELLSDNLAPYRYKFDDGSKFEGGFGFTELLLTDYWTLRQRSAQLFETNIYARGIVRRLITNEINTGLHLEATPEEVMLGMKEDDLADWSETVENRFAIWESDPRLCDQCERMTFGQLQALARLEALVAGDVLVVMRQDQRTKLPRIQLINGAKVQAPFLGINEQRGPNKIRHGVETDPTGRQVAYWVLQDDGTSKRLPAYGEKSGRRLAWLLYGTDKRMDDVRGKPLLALVLQSLREIDRYRDATQRKALINSMFAIFVKKTVDKPGTRPITGGAQRKGSVQTIDTSGTATRTFNFAEQTPGVVMDELQVGEEPVPFSTHGTDQAFGEFEAAILCGVAWSLELPPEILTLSFRNNYSASQAAINELKMYLNRARTDFGDNFCQLVYREWLLAETLNQRVEAPGLIDSWQDPARYDEFGAWVSSEWSGHIKPAVDLTKLVNGYAEMVNEGFITRDRASRELNGSKYSKNVQKLRLENEALAAANKALAPPKPSGPKVNAPTPTVPAGAAPKASHELGPEGEHGLDSAGRGKAPELMAWFLKPEIAAAMRAGRASGYHPTLEERARFEMAMREAYASKDAERPRNMTVADGTAEIVVEGVLTDKPDCFAMLFGGGNTTYQSIREALTLADSDPSVKNILMSIASPGGQVTGLFETLAAIEGTQKPIKVRASLAASAAYGIAAMAGPIEATTPASEFGSVGVATHVYIEEDAIDIASTEAPKKRPDVTTEDGVAAIREELDALHDLFADAIARGRSASTGSKVSAADVNANFGRGGVLVAKQAKASGMIDRIAAQPKRAPTGKRAEIEEEVPDAAPPKDASAGDGGAPTDEDTAMNKEELKSKHPELYAATVAEGVAAGQSAERERVVGHLTLAEGSGDMATAIASINSGEGMTAVVQAKHMKAAMRRNDVAVRQEESNAAGAVVAGAAATTGDGGKDLGDIVADRMDAASGKKPAAAA